MDRRAVVIAVTNVTSGLTAQPQTTIVTYAAVLDTTTSGVYVCQTDLSDELNGDVVEMQILITHGARTERQLFYAVFANVQADPMKQSIPVPLVAADRFRMMIRHVGGTPVISFTRAMTIG